MFSSDDSEDNSYDPSVADIFKKVQKDGLSSNESDFTSTLMSFVFEVMLMNLQVHTYPSSVHQNNLLSVLLKEDQ